MKQVSCIICGSENCQRLFYAKDRLLKIDDTKFQIVKCSNCGMVYINPQPTPIEIAKYYPSDYGPYNSRQVFTDSYTLRAIGSFRQHLLKNYPRLSENIKKTKQFLVRNHDQFESIPVVYSSDQISCLDFGCGSGRHMEMLREKYPQWEISGLDNSPIACEVAAAKGFKVYCGDAVTADLPKSTYDRVYMNSVIEHLHDPRQALQITNVALKLGGSLRLMTPNIASIGARLFRQYWHALDAPRHLHLFNQKTLETILNETGFVIKKLDYKKGMSVELKSFYHLINRNDRRMNPIIWQISVPIGKVLSKFGQASTIIVEAEKVREI